MNTFQILGVGLALFFLGVTVIALFRRRLSRKIGFAWITLWLGAAIAISRPELTAIVAEVLGIDRGADLVFYTAILAMFVGFFLVFARLRKTDETLTQILRHIALQEASEPHEPREAPEATLSETDP